MKKQVGSFLTGAVATAALPPSVGLYDWRIIAGAAAAGGVAGLFGINLSQRVKRYAAARKASPPPQE